MIFKDIIRETSNLTEDELISLNQCVIENIKAIRARKSAVARRHFDVGDSVYFKNGSDTIAGILQKKMRKYCNIKTGMNQTWRVPLSAIHKVER